MKKKKEKKNKICFTVMISVEAATNRQRHAGSFASSGKASTLNGDIRSRLRVVLADALEEGGLPGTHHPAPVIAARLEMCALAHTQGNPDAYLASMSRMVFNLRHNAHGILGAYPLSRVCKLSHHKMHKGTAHVVRDGAMDVAIQTLLQDAKSAADDATARAAQVTSSHAIRCPKCRTQTGIVRLARQTRAADEGMTTTCLCVACSWSWSLKS